MHQQRGRGSMGMTALHAYPVDLGRHGFDAVRLCHLVKATLMETLRARGAGLSAGGMLEHGLLRGGRGRKPQAESLGRSVEQRQGASALRGTIDEACPSHLKVLRRKEAVPGQ